MTKRELSLQSDICKSVRKENGWARKLSHQTMVGLPDLLVNRYPFTPLLIEVKDLGPMNQVFRRKLSVTEKQRYELISFDAATSNSFHTDTRGMSRKRWASALLVGWAWGRTHWLAMLPPDSEYVVVGDDGQNDPPMVVRQVGGYYPIGPLMELFGSLHKVKQL